MFCLRAGGSGNNRRDGGFHLGRRVVRTTTLLVAGERDSGRFVAVDMEYMEDKGGCEVEDEEEEFHPVMVKHCVMIYNSLTICLLYGCFSICYRWLL